MQKINVGIIGCGSITKHRHAPEYAENPFVNEIVFFDRNFERAQNMANEFGGRAVRTIEELLDDDSIVAISDCSPNHLHHVNTTRALLSGKHVLCEKPISITVDKAQEVLKAQEQSGKILMVDHNQRFTKAHQKVKELIDTKELGEVLTFKTTFGHQGPEQWSIDKSNATWFFKKERSYSGVAGDLGIHKIDLIHYLLSDEITEVKGFHGALNKLDENGEPIEVCDNVVCSMKTEKGRLGTASFSWTYYGSEDNSTTLYCEGGIIKIYQDPVSQVIVETKAGEVIKYELEQIQTNDNQTKTGVMDNFVDAIINNKKPLVTGKDAISSLKVIESILGETKGQVGKLYLNNLG